MRVSSSDTSSSSVFANSVAMSQLSQPQRSRFLVHHIDLIERCVFSSSFFYLCMLESFAEIEKEMKNLSIGTLANGFDVMSTERDKKFCHIKCVCVETSNCEM